MKLNEFENFRGLELDKLLCMIMNKTSPIFYAGMAMILVAFFSCKDNSKEHIVTENSESQFEKDLQKDLQAETIHTNSDYNYNHHNGDTGDYEHHYDVVGSNKDGSEVTGYIDIQGKTGNGVLEDELGNEIEVTAQWTSKTELRAVDNEGNVWDLIVE